MSQIRSFARPSLLFALVAAGMGVSILACEAEVETVCFDGQPCVVDQGTGGGQTTTTSAGPNTDIPCDVFAILEAKCQTCHNANHDNGAPIDLLTCGRFAENDCGDLGPRHATAASYVEMDFMPLGDTDLTAEEKEIVLGWLDDGAPCVPEGEGCTGVAGSKGCYE